MNFSFSQASQEFPNLGVLTNEINLLFFEYFGIEKFQFVIFKSVHLFLIIMN